MNLRQIYIKFVIALIILIPLNSCVHKPIQNEKVTKPEKITLFNGFDYTHWIGVDGEPVKWKILDGTMEIVPGTGSIVTREPFRDYFLHVEFNIPESPPQASGQGRGNSGVYNQGRYEVQILDTYGLVAGKRDCGALYGVKAPDHSVCRKPGKWQSYDITFRSPRWEGEGATTRKIENARITVIHNDVLIHDNIELESNTGAGWPEGSQPGPVLLQDHGHKVRYRNIWIIPYD